MAEKTDDLHTYTFSWSGPFKLTEEEAHRFAMDFSRLVKKRVGYFGAASFKSDMRTREEMDADPRLKQLARAVEGEKA